MFTKSLLLGSLCFFLFQVPAGADPLVYVVSAGLTGNGEFGTIDLRTGAYQQIGPGEPEGYFGLASGPNGSLITGTYAANLDSINQATGVPTRIGATGLGSCVTASDVCGPNSFAALGGFGGKIYATDFQNRLYTVNPLSGVATLLNSNTGIPAIPFIPTSTNPDGTINFYDEAIWSAGGKLYETFDATVFDLTSNSIVQIVIAPELYQIDPSTGAATVIGGTDAGIGAVVNAGGVTYALNDVMGQITTINLSSGKTTFVTNFDPAAGVIQGAVAATPEPSSLVLSLLGLGLAIWRWRTRCSPPSEGCGRGFLRSLP